MTNKKIKNNKTMAKKTPPALKAARLCREAEEQRLLAQQKDDEFEEDDDENEDNDYEEDEDEDQSIDESRGNLLTITLMFHGLLNVFHRVAVNPIVLHSSVPLCCIKSRRGKCTLSHLLCIHNHMLYRLNHSIVLVQSIPYRIHKISHWSGYM